MILTDLHFERLLQLLCGKMDFRGGGQIKRGKITLEAFSREIGEEYREEQVCWKYVFWDANMAHGQGD